MAEASLSDLDRACLEQVFLLMDKAIEDGRHPFAAVVANADGTVVAEAINNSMPPNGDPTQHAELVAAAAAARSLPSDRLAQTTLYTNVEPCAMCAGAIYWCGIGRVIYMMSETALLQLTGNHPENPTLDLPCRQIFATGQHSVQVIGPIDDLVERATLPHLSFWQR